MVEGARGGWKPEFVFEGDEERETEADNLTDDQLLCEAPLEDGTLAKVYETDRAYLCPDMAPAKQKNGTRIAKEILKKEIPADQAMKLFIEGKTDVVAGFISKKGRPFRASATGQANWKARLGIPAAPGEEESRQKKSAKKA